MRGPLLPFAILLTGAVLVLVWALWSDGQHAGVAALPSQESSVSPEATDPEDDLLETSAFDEDAAAASGRVGLAPYVGESAQAIEPRTLRVLVVDRATGAPVGGASVRSAPMSALRSTRERTISPDPEEELARAGVETRTDEHGEATVDLSDMPASIDARAGDRWGHRRIGEGASEPIRIEVSEDRSITVQTVDLSGRPLADVPVALRRQRERGDARELWANRTRGEQAIAVVPHLDALLEERRPDGDLTIGLACLTREPVSERIDLDALPEQPIRIVVPATGSIAIRVEDPAGRPVRRALVRIALAPIGDRAGAEPGAEIRIGLGTDFGRGPSVRPIEALAGRAVESAVEIGLDLVVEARSDEGWKPVSVRVAGPRRAGENVETTLRFGASFPRLSGRLVDEHGAVLARRSVRAKVIDRDVAPSEPAAKPLGRLYTSTDENGSFQLVLDPVPPPRADEIELGVLDDRRSPSLVARVALPANFSAGGLALGDIVVRGAPILLGGLVVDEAGAPVSGARIDVERELDPGAGRSGRGWRRDIDLAGKTDASGRFAIRGSDELGSLRVSAAREGFARADWVAAQPGDCEMRLVLEHAGDVAGRLELDPGIAPDLFSIRVRSRRANGAAASTSRAPVLRDGTFRVESLRPDVVDIAVLFGADPEPIAEVPSVLVAGGAIARDPRLDPLDLRGRAKLVRIDVVDADRRPVRQGKVFVTQTEPMPTSVVFELADGRALVPLHGQSIELGIRAPGYREQRLAGVDGDRTVELEQAIVVRLRLAPGVRLPQAPMRLAVTLTPAGATGNGRAGRGEDREARRRAGRGSAQSNSLFKPDGEAQVELSAPGTYSVRFDVRAGNARPAPMDSAPATIEVADYATEQVFVVAPEAVRYEQALRAAR